MAAFEYLSPLWEREDGEMEQEEAEKEAEAAIAGANIALTTQEVFSYLTKVQEAHRVGSGAEGESIEEMLATHADANSRYCRRLLMYLLKKHAPWLFVKSIKRNLPSADERRTTLLQLFSEYKEFAPGLWSTAVLLDALEQFILPSLFGTRDVTSSLASTSSLAATGGTYPSWDMTEPEEKSRVSSDGIDDFDDTSDTHSMLSTSVTGESTSTRLKRAMLKMNRYKTEIAVLKEALQSARMTDVTLLRDKLRGAHADLTRVRQRNTELKDRVQILEAGLFRALQKKQNNTIAGVEEEDEENVTEEEEKEEEKRADEEDVFIDAISPGEENKVNSSNSSSGPKPSFSSSSAVSFSQLALKQLAAKKAKGEVEENENSKKATPQHVKKLMLAYEARLASMQVTQ